MSDVSGGPGWWQASDGRWYPPRPPAPPPFPGQHDSPASAPPPASGAAPAQWPPPVPAAYGPSPSGAAPYGQSPYGQSPYGQSPPGYGGAGGYGAPRPTTNGFAVASLVCSCTGALFGLGPLLGVIFGFIARSQIRRSNGMQGGGGLALAGIIVGFVLLALGALALVVVLVAVGNANVSNGN